MSEIIPSTPEWFERRRGVGMGSSPEPPASLLTAIYRVLDDSNSWPEALREFCSYMETSYASVLNLQILRTGVRVRQFVVWGLSDEDMQEYFRLWAAKDPWSTLGMDFSSVPGGYIGDSAEACPDDILEANECYQSFLKPRDLHYGGSVFLLNSPRSIINLGTLRPKSKGRLTPLEFDRLEAASTHFQKVLRVQEERDCLTTQRDLLAGVFNTSGLGFVLLDQTGGVLVTNSRAKAILEQAHTLVEKDGQLLAVNAEENRVLHEVIRRTLDPWEREKAPSGEIVSLGAQREEGAPLRLLIVPANPGKSLTPSATSAAAIVQIVDRDAPLRIDHGTLRRLFSLSRAEAEVGEKLAGGLSIVEIAEELHVSQHTVRSHLKNLFLKTSTNQQSALVSLILRLQPPMSASQDDGPAML